MPVSVLVPLSLLASASAFAPNPAVPTDVPAYRGVEPQRRLVTHAGEQARLADGAAWQRFVGGVGAGWTATWDEAAGTPRQAWGEGIPVGPAGSDDPSDGLAIQAAVGAILAEHADLFGFEPGALAPGRVEHHAPSDTWYVSFDWLPGAGADAGVPVVDKDLSARVKRGNLILLAVETTPDAPIVGGWTIDSGAAIAAAIAQGPAPGAAHREISAERRLLERRTPDGLVLARVWEVRTRTGGADAGPPGSTAAAAPVGKWVSYVDAATGELLHVHNDVLFISGTIEGRHHERTPTGALVTSPLPLVRVSGGGSVYADEEGDYSLSGGGPISVGLSGSYLSVDNQGGSNGGASSSSGDLTIDSNDASQAEIDTYVFVHQAREWGQQADGANGMARASLDAYVNINDICNAYFDGNVNFFRAGGPCTNTGQNMDVVHHEWGHGFHYYQIRSGNFDNSLSEGAADTVAFLQSGSPEIGPYFFTNGGPVRDVTDFRVYPQDYNDRADPHENGLIFGGAMWDLWELLRDAEGSSAGTASTQDIFAGLLRGGSDIPGSYAEALAADDDDGSLGNGTPHQCQIDAAFGAHGLGPGGGGGGGGGFTEAKHTPIEVAAPGKKVKAKFELPSAGACSSGVARSATLHYRVNGGDWIDEPADAAGDTVTGTMGAFDEGDFVEYWLEGLDTQNNAFESPRSGRVGAFTFYVGETMEVWCEDFSDGAGGFRAKAYSGNNDWGFGVPNGDAGDPARGATGQKVWGTDVARDGLYSANSSSRLRTPDLDTKHFEDVFLRYQRWLTVEDKNYDQATIRVGNPGGDDPEEVWGNGGAPSGDEATQDDRWMSHVVDLQGLADRSREVFVDFQLDTDGGAEFGGWNLDDLCLLAPATPNNRLGVNDLVATPGAGAVELRWTQPAHESVERVVVVRRSDRFPEGPDDGTVVADLSGVEAGDEASLLDVLVRDDVYYAIYASDGEDWSTFTEEGLNAVLVEDLEAAPSMSYGAGDGSAGVPGACACDQRSGLGGLGAWVAALSAVALRRRRA